MSRVSMSGGFGEEPIPLPDRKWKFKRRYNEWCLHIFFPKSYITLAYEFCRNWLKLDLASALLFVGVTRSKPIMRGKLRPFLSIHYRGHREVGLDHRWRPYYEQR